MPVITLAEVQAHLMEADPTAYKVGLQSHMHRLGQNRICIRCIYGTFGTEITKCTVTYDVYIGLVRTIYIRCVYGIFGRKITKNTVIYDVYIRFWPTLLMCERAHFRAVVV